VFFGRNLPTTNAIRQLKGSKDAAFPLVYSKEKAKKLPLELFIQDPMTPSANPWSCLSCVVLPKNVQT